MNVAIVDRHFGIKKFSTGERESPQASAVG